MIHKKGNRLHHRTLVAQTIAAALREELGRTGAAAKTLGDWTHGSERSAKNWLSGKVGPSAEHLICMMGRSNVVLKAVLELADRKLLVATTDLLQAQRVLHAAVEAVDALVGDSH